MKKVIKIFLRNKANEIWEGLKLGGTIISILTVTLVVITIILGVFGYITGIFLKEYEWFWNYTGKECSEKIIDIAGAGIPIFVLGVFIIVGISILSWLVLYLIPKAFINWIKDNWEQAKREANYK